MEHGIVCPQLQGIRDAQGKGGELPDFFVVESNWQEVSTKTLLVEIKQVWQEEMHLVAGDHNIVKQEKNKDFSVSEEKSEHERVAFTSNLQTSEVFSVTRDLLKQNIDVASVQQHVNENIQLCCKQ